MPIIGEARQPILPKYARIHRCCFCINLRSVVIVLGILSIVWNVYIIILPLEERSKENKIYLIEGEQSDDKYYILHIILQIFYISNELVSIILGFMLIIGVNNGKVVQIYFKYCLLHMVIILPVFYLFLESKSPIEPFMIEWVIMCAIYLVIDLCYIICVTSYYEQLLDQQVVEIPE